MGGYPRECDEVRVSHFRQRRKRRGQTCLRPPDHPNLEFRQQCAVHVKIDIGVGRGESHEGDGSRAYDELRESCFVRTHAVSGNRRVMYVGTQADNSSRVYISGATQNAVSGKSSSA